MYNKKSIAFVTKNIIVNIFPFTISLTLAGIFSSFLAPIDYMQGYEYRIIFVHVPCAWISVFLYGIITLSSISALCLKHPLFNIVTFYGAKIGTVFTLLTLSSGCLWGKPMWGTFWVWDARLTSTLILFLIYLGYLQLQNFQAMSPNHQMGSIFICIGSLNLPIIKYSVSWWSTLHQPSSITQFSTSIHSSMLIPLDLQAISFILIIILILCLEIRYEIIQQHKNKI